MDMTLERLQKNFEILPDWQARYAFIIEMGKKNQPVPEALMVEDNRVHGCMSQVYLVLDPIDDDEKVIRFQASSDALIVNGLIAILKIVYNNKPLSDVQHIDIKAIFKDLGLEQHLSPIRRNGFFSMVERLNQLASTH
jgi:cysteine desulfuration protein SufE